MTDIEVTRIEILHLRARIVALERMAFAALELALRIRPEELTDTIEMARKRLEVGYDDPDFTPDITDPEERSLLAKEVERLMRGIQSELGLRGGIATPENG